MCRYTLEGAKSFRRFDLGKNLISLQIPECHFASTFCALHLASAVFGVQNIQLCVQTQTSWKAFFAGATYADRDDSVSWRASLDPLRSVTRCEENPL